MNKSSNETSPNMLFKIKILRIRTLNKIIIGSLNINSLPSKFEQLIFFAIILHHAICISYRTVPSTIWPLFSEFLIFCRLISQAFRRVKWNRNMRNEENIGHIVRNKRAITSLSLSWKISAFCYCNSTLSREKNNNKFLFPSNH